MRYSTVSPVPRYDFPLAKYRAAGYVVMAVFLVVIMVSRGAGGEIAAVVVWRVVDSARAVFGVDNFTSYVHTQSESAVRQLARSYPYDAFDEDAAG